MGLHNAISNGRSVTFVLQNLQSKDLFGEDFRAWYDDQMKEMRLDPKAKWFVELRNRLEKQGTLGDSFIRVSGAIVRTADLMRDAPAGAESRFVGDQLGRSGWHVRLPDGSKTIVFTASPEALKIEQSMDDAPDGFDLRADLHPWLDELERLIDRAESRFVAG